MPASEVELRIYIGRNIANKKTPGYNAAKYIYIKMIGENEIGYVAAAEKCNIAANQS